MAMGVAMGRAVALRMIGGVVGLLGRVVLLDGGHGRIIARDVGPLFSAVDKPLAW